ncbi:MAG: error-prone DNA polymerase [Gammaproteobacteria bacterium]|jgi:error-prone DNA polymerase
MRAIGLSKGNIFDFIMAISKNPFSNFHEWLCKTNFSFLQGASHPVDLVTRANELDYGALCINDFDGGYGLARSYRELLYLKKRDQHQNLKLNYAAEIHFEVDHHLPVLLQHTLVLVAKDLAGYGSLNKILSYAHRDGKDGANLPFAYLLNCDVSGLFAIQPMRGKIRCQSPQSREDISYYAELKNLFQGDFYLAISRHLHPAEDRWIQPTLALAKKYQIPILLSQDVFFHQRSQKSMSDLLQAIRNNKVFDECQPYYFPNSERCLHRADELHRLFAGIPDYQAALSLSAELNQSCVFDLSQLSYHYPKEMIPSGHSAQSFLRELVNSGVLERFGQNPPQKILDIIEHELRLIQQLNFADYFLTVWDIVCWARTAKILCQGRGSAANSTVCYVLGITSVNPAQFDLLFERFISMERGDPPDIDVDFEHERREEVIQYIYRRYGRDRAAMVANVITFRGKGALRAVGKALGASEVLLKQMSKIASSRHFRGAGMDNIVKALKDDHEKKHAEGNKISWNLWVQLSDKLQGFPRHMGIHSGGFMLADKPLNCLLAHEPASMEGRTVIQWCKEDIEALGFFKIDVLSLGMLSAIRKCFDMVEYFYHQKLSLHGIPDDDKPTYKMIQKAETVGTFQIESRAQMSMLPRLKPNCFYDLVIEVAIIRPGPIQGKVIHPYLARREGLEAVTYPDPRLEPILKRTLGIAIFQEQAMRIAIAVGNFSAGEADELRKNIGSWGIKDFGRDLHPLLLKLEQGMQTNGIAPEFAEQILGQMKGFAEYGFPESHAVSFSLIAYASCYLKCHYPVAFYTSILNSQPMGFYSPHALLQSAQREGVTLLPLSLNVSIWDHGLEQLPDANSAQEQYGIRLGFRLINGLSKAAVDSLLEVRDNLGHWLSFEHFVATNQLARDDLTALAATDVFNELGLTRSTALWQAEAAPYQPMLDDQETTLDWKPEQALERIQKDFRAFKTSLTDHPVRVIKQQQWPFSVPLEKLTESSELVSLMANTDVFVFGMVLVKQSPGSAKGMVFVTLEDEKGFLNLAFTPQVYAQFHQQVDHQPYICVVGKLQRVNESHSILVKRVFVAETSASLLPMRKRHQLAEAEPVNPVELVKPRAFR